MFVGCIYMFTEYLILWISLIIYILFIADKIG